MIINADGGARGNPGPGACGIVIRDRDGNVVKRKGKYLGFCTNNEAEYHGLILGLESVLELGTSSAEVNMDSELVVKQLTGQYRVKDPKLTKLYSKAKALEQKFSEVRYFSVKRERNKEADAIVNQILDAQANAKISSQKI